MKKLIFLCLFIIVTGTTQSQSPTIKTNTGHTRGLKSFLFTPDGTTLISTAADNQVKFWNIISGKEIKSFNTKLTWTSSLDLLHDGKTIVTASRFSKLVKLLDIKNGKEIDSIDLSQLYTQYGGILSVKSFPDVSSIGVLSNTGPFFKIDCSTKQVKWTYKLTDEYFYSFDITPNGESILLGIKCGIGLKTGGAHEIDKEGNLKRKIGYGTFYSLCISPDGSKFLTGGGYYDKLFRVQLWDMATGQLIATLGSHSNDVNSLAFSPDGKMALSGGADSLVKQWDLVAMKEIACFKWHNKGVTYVKFSPDGLTAASAGNDNNIVLWNIFSLQKLQILGNLVNRWDDIDYSSDGKTILTKTDDRIVLWDVATVKPIKEFKGHTKELSCGKLSPNNKMALSSSYDANVKIWNIETGRIITSFTPYTPKKKPGGNVYFSPDSKYVISSDDNGKLILWDIVKSSVKWETNSIDNFIFDIAFTHDGKYIITASTDPICRVWDAETGEMFSSIRCNDGKYSNISISPDDNSILLKNIDTYVVDEYSFKSGVFGSKIRSYDFKTIKNEKIAFANYSPDGKQFVVASDAKKIGIQTNEGYKLFSLVTNSISQACYSPNGKRIATIGEDNSLCFWDVDSMKLIVSLYLNKNCTDWLAITPDGYFDASANGGDMVSMVQGDETYGIEQFAVRNNRPDIVLKRIGLAPQDQLNHLYSQYQKRLRKLGFVNKNGQPSESLLSVEVHAPTSAIGNVKVIGKTANLKAIFNDSKYSLKNYNVYVNDVPLYGPYGKPIIGSNDTIAESIALTNGLNIIEVSCLNEKGVESTRAMVSANCTDILKGDLYFMGFGVSTYKDPKLNLNYAHKDLLDLAECFNMMKGEKYNNVFTKTYINQEATVANIKKSKSFLANAKPEDTFILFIAGHGMHDNDKEATYYYLTWEANLKSLKTTAADFETIEDILQGIQPRNKLFLMDACESGELDEDDQNSFLTTATGAGIASRGFKKSATKPVEVGASTPLSAQNGAGGSLSGAGGSLSGAEVKRPYLYQKDRYIYNDLIRRSGAIVFSSSKGGELSYERSDIQNGLFTESIMKAFTTNEADKDGDGKVTTNELRSYVTGEVSSASNDLQHPTVDRDNRKVKYNFPVVIKP